MTEACRKCGNDLFLTERKHIGNGITELRCWRCGCYNEIYPPAMKQASGSAQGCEFPECEDATDTEYGRYCALHRKVLRLEGRRLKRWVRQGAGVRV